MSLGVPVWRCLRVQAMSSVEKPKDLHEYIASALDRIGGSEDLSDLTALNAAGAEKGGTTATAGEGRGKSELRQGAKAGGGGASGAGEGTKGEKDEEGEEAASLGSQSSLLTDLMSSCLTTLLVIKVRSLACAVQYWPHAPSLGTCVTCVR